MEPQTANSVVKYARKETNVTALHGSVACELSTSNYGKDEWWMLVRTS